MCEEQTYYDQENMVRPEEAEPAVAFQDASQERSFEQTRHNGMCFGSMDAQEATEDDYGASHIALGKRGEDAAVSFLMRHGIDVIDRNWSCPAGEVDIVARDEYSLRFVEVKTRRGTGQGFPEEAVDYEKRHRYERIAEYYLQQYERTDIAVNFDIIGILVTGPNRAFLRYHKNAFARDF